jgi:hypothetical protein
MLLISLEILRVLIKWVRQFLKWNLDVFRSGISGDVGENQNQGERSLEHREKQGKVLDGS